jgi:hypothetical protein
LGKNKATSAIPVLLKQLQSFGYDRLGGPELEPVLGQSPCAGALAAMGKEALPAVKKEITTSIAPDRTMILLYIIKKIVGREELKRMANDHELSPKGPQQSAAFIAAYKYIDNPIEASRLVEGDK